MNVTIVKAAYKDYNPIDRDHIVSFNDTIDYKLLIK